ncbi:TetR family transcriptional regulator C-terminal domain-containing protein [Cryobacterium zongtaii]|nr:TetR family transcriptional regulator C-terminal domain-containing protein [Cryobacterium zongtaii]
MLSAFLRRMASDALHPGIVELHCLMSAETIAPDHPAHDRHRERYREVRECLAATFQEITRDDGLRTPNAPDMLASGFSALLDGLQLQWVHDNSTDALGATQGKVVDERIELSAGGRLWSGRADAMSTLHAEAANEATEPQRRQTRPSEAPKQEIAPEHPQERFLLFRPGGLVNRFAKNPLVGLTGFEPATP